MKSSKKLPNYHPNSFSKSQFYCEKRLCLVMLFWNFQNQNKQKGISRWSSHMKCSKKLPNYHSNSSSKSQFYCEKHLCLVMLFWNVQNQNKQKGVSRFLYQNNNKRLHFFTKISPKSFFKISVFLVKKVKSCNTFIYWEPNNKLGL